MREQYQKKSVVLVKRILKSLHLLEAMFCISYFFDLFKRHCELCLVKRKWENLNQHNNTYVANTIYNGKFLLDKVKVGKGTYGPLCIHAFKTQEDYLEIGNYCSIANGVQFILGGNHHMDCFSTYPFRAIYNGEIESCTNGPIIVEDDVWIGTNALILSGCRIGRGTVIAAGSVVTKSTLPFSIVGGSPAKLIRMRFTDEVIHDLLEFDYSKIEISHIKENIDLLYQPICSELLNDIRQKIFTDKE